MIQIIDIAFLFTLSFSCFFITYRYLRNQNYKGEKFKETLNRRIATLSRQQDMLLESAGGDRVSTFKKLQHEEFGKSANSGDTTMEKIKILMQKAGIVDITVNTFITMCCIGGIGVAAAFVHFNFLHFVTGIPVGFCVGAYLVYSILAAQAQQKKTKFLEQFPEAIDMMVRGVKAGLNINRIMKLVSTESKDPISTEYKIISQKFDLGVKPEKVLVEAADKIDIEEFRFLVVALVLQMENGGVLGEILQNLSGMVRKRLELGLKLKAMSAEARMSAIVLSALPFVFAGIMFVVNPSHLQEFTKPGAGQMLLRIMLVLFSLGTFLMFKATKIKV